MKLIKFYTDWCMPCKALTRILNEKVNLNGVELVEIDAETNPDIANKYGIKTVPVLIFEKSGNIVDRISGIVSPEVIEQKISLYK